MAAVFISHSSLDNVDAIRLKDRLEGWGFEQVFLDCDGEKGILGGDYWERVLYRRLESSVAVLILLSPNWLSSRECFAEFRIARFRGKRVIPARIADCEWKSVASDVQQVDLRSKSDAAFDSLKRALEEAEFRSSEVFPIEENRAPYPGFTAFEFQDRAFFYGRDDEIRQALEELTKLRRRGLGRLLLLEGASGSGKSSLMHAGIIPHLGLPYERSHWIVGPTVRPRQRPMTALLRCFDRIVMDQDVATAQAAFEITSQNASLDTLVDRFENIIENVGGTIGKANATVLIPIDQLEEVVLPLSISPTDERVVETRRFCQLLACIVRRPAPIIQVIAT